MSDCDNEDGDSDKPHLDPEAVIAMASSIANCSHISPPNQRQSSLATNQSIPAVSASESSYFSQFLSTFSNDEEQKKSDEKEQYNNQVLSFLVSDAYSIEQMAAEAEGNGSTSALDGAGMSRIDVYCKSGTVITCRLVQVPEDDEIEGMVDEEDNNTSDNNTGIDVKKRTINTQGTQVRRIIRRKCTLETLRKILEQPPKLPEINTNIIASVDDSNDQLVPNELRKRQQKSTFSNLSKAQQKFLKEQQKQYEKRARRDERMRQNVGNAILQGGLEGVEGMDINSLSLSASSSFPTAMSEDRGNPTSTAAHRTQLEIQDKIEIADMGLAILMGESQRLERIMQSMKDTNESKTDKDDDDDVQSKQSSCTGIDDTDRSMSTYQSTNDEGSDDEDDDAILMQGCEVEYSFPYEFHDELEKALMGDDASSSSSDSEADDYTSSKKTPRQRRGRGRSPPRDGFVSKHKDDIISPIVATPTNGKGCVVLRENGTFDIVGEIPEVLEKKLFRSKGPLPDQISLGSLGRYYVHFRDGSFFFYGPPSLSKILIKGNKRQRRGKDRNRGKREDACISSVAFGKDLDDFFVVRTDGSWEMHGSLPPGLECLMNDRKNQADLRWVQLGSNGEWAVKAKNGRVWWDGVSEEADEGMAEVLAEDGENELRFIDFGSDNTYFLLHK